MTEETKEEEEIKRLLQESKKVFEDQFCTCEDYCPKCGKRKRKYPKSNYYEGWLGK